MQSFPSAQRFPRQAQSCHTAHVRIVAERSVQPSGVPRLLAATAAEVRSLMLPDEKACWFRGVSFIGLFSPAAGAAIVMAILSTRLGLRIHLERTRLR